jgi:hypothetical protein
MIFEIRSSPKAWSWLVQFLLINYYFQAYLCWTQLQKVKQRRVVFKVIIIVLADQELDDVSSHGSHAVFTIQRCGCLELEVRILLKLLLQVSAVAQLLPFIGEEVVYAMMHLIPFC